jgi:hypothetical protein
MIRTLTFLRNYPIQKRCSHWKIGEIHREGPSRKDVFEYQKRRRAFLFLYHFKRLLQMISQTE